MYIWVLLATFITILYSFNPAVREDIRSVKVAPIAEAVISKTVIQQKSAKDYFQKNLSTIKSSTNSYFPLDSEDLVDYAPYGFKIDGNGVQTDIFCLKDDNILNTPIACNNIDAKRFVISYGAVPNRWVNLSSGMPNNDYKAAIKNVMGFEPTFGYTVPKQGGDIATGTYESEMEIKNNDKVRVFIPQYIIGSEDFAAACAGSGHCLVYLSSM